MTARSSSIPGATSRTGVVLLALVGGIVACWLLLMPPGAGPDEQGHLVRSGVVIRGDFGDSGSYLLPDRYAIPGPGCYAFDPTVSAECADFPVRTGEEVAFTSRAGNYPIWGHAVYGAASLVPGVSPMWWARVVGAAVATGLVVWALRTTLATRGLTTAAALLGLTPMAWSVFATVNPSSFVTAGALALWVGLLSRAEPTPATPQMLVAVGWAALALPRRDGLIWAFITLAFALAVTDRTALGWWRSLAVAARSVIGLSTLVTVAWGATSDSRTSRMVALAPLILITTESARWWWSRSDIPRRVRATGLLGGVLVATAALGVLLSRRPGGWDTALAVDVISQTDENLVEAIGVLGWLDTLVPWPAVFMWLMLIGVLVTVALMTGGRATAWAGVLAAVTVVTAWVFELFQGSTSATYWQGRYSIPLLIGIPILLTLDTDRIGDPAEHILRRLDLLVTGGALTILNIAAWAAARRFGVGTLGSHLPWRWKLDIQPVAPVVLLIIHAALSAALLVFVTGERARSPEFARR